MTGQLQERIEEAKDILRLGSEMSLKYYKKPLLIAYSGGKDSDVVLSLAEETGIPFEVFHSVTSVDAPQTNRHVNEVFQRLTEKGIHCEKHIPTYKGEITNMWKLIEKKGPPTRVHRFCCAVLKETSIPNRLIALGVRAKESIKRRKREAFETKKEKGKDALSFTLSHADEVYKDAKRLPEIYDCTLITKAKQNNDLMCNPIIHWSDGEVWDYLRERGTEINPLYCQGWNRVGCIGCPMAGKARQKEFAQFPEIEALYRKSFAKFLEIKRAKGTLENTRKWTDADSMFLWWMEDETIPGQMELKDLFPEQFEESRRETK